MPPVALSKKKPLPPWLNVKLPAYNAQVQQLLATTQQLGLATVCQQARCPNLGECWSEGTATFMLMGERCSRHCTFCAVPSGSLQALDAKEPAKIAQVVKQAGWLYVVLTTVNRDDLADGGAAHIAKTINAVRAENPSCIIEVLIPDFNGNAAALHTVLEAMPDVLAHNLETVERLSPMLRDRRAAYQQSLSLLHAAKQFQEAGSTVSFNKPFYTKSSLMLGVGETQEELEQALQALRTAGVELLTLGQYLQPTPKHWPITEYVTPDRFAHWKQRAEQEFGFTYCASGPLVRSSYKAMEAYVASSFR